MPYIARSTPIVVSASPMVGPRVATWSDLEQRIGLSESRLARSMALLDKASVLLDQTMTRIDRLWQRPPTSESGGR